MDSRDAPARALVEDAVLLPVSRGHLLVSPQAACFCPVSTDQVPALEAALQGSAPLEGLPTGLLASLDRHGWFAPPQVARAQVPSVQLQLTNACNLACDYCCMNSGPRRSQELTREEWFRIASEIPEAMGPETQVSIFGGEPLLVPFAIELAEHLVAQGLHLTISTNATPLRNPALAARAAALIKSGAKVRASLAGATAAACDAVSGAPRFQHVLAGLHAVARHGVRCAVDLMLMPANVDDASANLHALRELLPEGTEIAIGILFHGGREAGANLFASKPTLESALDRIAFEAGERIAGPAPSPIAPRRDGCGCAMGEAMTVRSDGALFTCFKMEEQVGDIRAEGFREAARRSRCSPHPANSLHPCAQCPLVSLCGGGCRAENLQFTGDADTPVCGPWRVQVLAELLAEDRPDALEWPVRHLLAEAHARGLSAPKQLVPARPSRSLVDTR